MATQKETAAAIANAEADSSASITDTVGNSASRNVLTDGHPTPPGLQERRSRRTRRKERTGPFVKYVGSASHRVIRPSDWGQLGFKPKDEKVGHMEFLWNPKNDFLIESSKFTDEQLDYLLIDDVMPGGGQSFLEVDYYEDEAGNKVLAQVVDGD